MSAPGPPANHAEAVNRNPQLAPAPAPAQPNLSTTSTLPPSTQTSLSPAPSSWSSQSPMISHGPTSASFPQYSATTAEILHRIRSGVSGSAVGTPAFEAKKAEIMQNYLTSDKLPTPTPIANPARRGRGGRTSTPSQSKTETGASPAPGGTPAATRGSGRGRGRGRSRGGGRGGKRKRSETSDSDDDSDISSSYTPLPTRTKSGRSVNKPVSFVPTLPEPSQGVKRRKSAKAILAAQCTVCHRGSDPSNNRIVFCDSCSNPYHQYCHDPPIDNEVVDVLEKEWLCGPCERSKQNVVEGTQGLTPGTGLSIDEKRAYLSTLPQDRLVSLLLHATVRHPELPLFPPNVEDLIPETPTTSAVNHSPSVPAPAPPSQPPKPPAKTAPPNGSSSATHVQLRIQQLGREPSDSDPAEAQLLGEMTFSNGQPSSNKRQPPQSSTSATNGVIANTIKESQLQPQPPQQQQQQPSEKAQDAVDGEYEEDDDGYDTDPPAHYPKPGQGLARNLPPESEDLRWLVDDNFEVFSHSWGGAGAGGDGSGGGGAGGGGGH
ncbi:uncharacterized protein EI97DRAFT_437487 [Westerdykella ornata]|uniref:PHD-type domain-containing protein n=1 Tax=Westerdykella ornata TaxID=318751 RepID=A0A6A6J5D4_WESOR|nr:uncharacterized protein EI97DRAFT_437487 [Westerdykella ornata]KAF2271800.1 hypothetical protein EI97DRAFT_437487 [Westerdykella ornata]